LDYQEIYLLQNLRRVSPQRLTEIARVLDIPMFSASRLVERLVQKKLITKEKGVEDRRSISVSLLPEGEKVVGLVEQDSYERIMDSAKEMSKEDFASLLQMSERLHQVLGVSKSVIQ
jgi:DNA-binding MarR family transcriptional regulator